MCGKKISKTHESTRQYRNFRMRKALKMIQGIRRSCFKVLGQVDANHSSVIAFVILINLYLEQLKSNFIR